MVIKINSEEELAEIAKELIHVLTNLRHFTRMWENDYGVELKRRKKYYEAKADELIDRLKVKEHRTVNDIKFKID